MRKSQNRFIMDMDRIRSAEYASVCRIAENTFIRNRKMPLQDLLLTMINRKGLTLTLELRNYMKTAHPGKRLWTHLHSRWFIKRLPYNQNRNESTLYSDSFLFLLLTLKLMTLCKFNVSPTLSCESLIRYYCWWPDLNRHGVAPEGF